MRDAITPEHFQAALHTSRYLSAVIQLIIAVLFIGSVHKTLEPVSNERCVVPKWLLWFLLLPILNLVFYNIGSSLALMVIVSIAFMVFAWILIPFAVPNSLRRQYGSNAKLVGRINTLQRIGLWCILCLTVLSGASFGWGMGQSGLLLQKMAASAQPSLPAVMGLIPFFSIGYIVLAIIYWCKIVSFRRAANEIS